MRASCSSTSPKCGSSQTVAAAADLIADRLQEHAIKLDIDTAQAPFASRATRPAFAQVLYNLLSNAANYAPEASTIKLACRATDSGRRIRRSR